MEVELRLKLLEMAQRDVERLLQVADQPADECRQTVSVVAGRLSSTLKLLQDVARREAAVSN
jgi:hypothetical protein